MRQDILLEAFDRAESIQPYFEQDVLWMEFFYFSFRILQRKKFQALYGTNVENMWTPMFHVSLEVKLIVEYEDNF